MANELVEVGLSLPALSGLGNDYNEEMSGMKITFDRIKVPSGGGLAFEVPGDDPDSPDLVKEIVGVVVDQYPVNAYWKDKYTGQNNQPDCSSLDGHIGSGTPGGDCSKCPMNQWGSDGTKGKACKNMRRLYILTENNIFPLLLTLPPTSIQNWADFLAKKVLQKRLQRHEVIVKITLRKETNASGIVYSQVQFSLVGMVPSDKLAQIAKYCADIKPLTRAVMIGGDETTSSHADSIDDLPF